MDLVLKRELDPTAEGVFGTLQSEDGMILFHTLEHAFPDGSEYAPKLDTGVHRCVKGVHTLDHTPVPFEAFEITGVPGHSGILFHIGNYNKDSDGCVLLGETVLYGRTPMLQSSKLAFEKFMKLQTGVDSFTLTVE